MTASRLDRSSDKRASLPRVADYTKAFVKDWDRLARTGRHNMANLKTAMLLLIANDAPLGPEWHDHPLKGRWSGHRECHISGDLLLVYYLSDEATNNCIVFVRAGTHSELFE